MRTGREGKRERGEGEGGKEGEGERSVESRDRDPAGQATRPTARRRA